MIPIIDLFAGPGGLGEGFSCVEDKNGNPIFQILMSIERDKSAHKTLRLRAFARKLYRKYGRYPVDYIEYLRDHDSASLDRLVNDNPKEWADAGKEATCAELVEGDDSLVLEARERLESVLGPLEARDRKPWVLIGGPPCQAYSLVGRARRTHDKAGLEADKKQTLYKCYLEFIRQLKPTAFVMENVKGLLSAKHKGSGVFSHIVSDMAEAGYEIRSLVTEAPEVPHDYIVRAEFFGVPQARHRVILLGVRKGEELSKRVLEPTAEATVREAFKGIPRIRSTFSSRKADAVDASWPDFIHDSAASLIDAALDNEDSALVKVLGHVAEDSLPEQTESNHVDGDCGRYEQWYRGRLGNSRVLANHRSRSHMPMDLVRYLYCSSYAAAEGTSPKLNEFPAYLVPEHKNAQAAKEGKLVEFADRFRVQSYDRCSTTITSHISKDGHYYIHPDPEQCRSLTVREAARLQTFPDDYLFEGNRTAQYTQVGNAVPPMLAMQIAQVVASCLAKTAEDRD